MRYCILAAFIMILAAGCTQKPEVPEHYSGELLGVYVSPEEDGPAIEYDFSADSLTLRRGAYENSYAIAWFDEKERSFVLRAGDLHLPVRWEPVNEGRVRFSQLEGARSYGSLDEAVEEGAGAEMLELARK